MMKNVVCVLFFMINILGCSDEMVFSGSKNKSRIVVTAVGNLDSNIRFKLVESQYITTDTVTSPIQSAELRLYRNGTLEEAIKSDQNGNLITDYRLKHNDTVRFIIRKDGFEIVNSQAVVPGEIKLIDFDTLPARLGSNIGLRLVLDDDPRVKNYYLLEMYAERWKYTVDPTTLKRTDSVLILEQQTMNSVSKIFFSDQNIVTNQEKYQLFTDKIFDGQIYRLDLNLSTLDFGETLYKGKVKGIVTKLRNINDDYFNFLSSLSLNRPIYGGPLAISAQVAGNIEGGYGYFALNSSATASIVLK